MSTNQSLSYFRHNVLLVDYEYLSGKACVVVFNLNENLKAFPIDDIYNITTKLNIPVYFSPTKELDNLVSILLGLISIAIQEKSSVLPSLFFGVEVPNLNT